MPFRDITNVSRPTLKEMRHREEDEPVRFEDRAVIGDREIAAPVRVVCRRPVPYVAWR